MGTVLKVIAVGDSAMWGQGLRREDTFARLAAERIASHFRKTLEFRNLARSGAKLEARTDKSQAVVFRLRSKKVIPTFRGDRHTFLDRFPELFKSDKAAEDFLNEDVDVQAPAEALFGDIPATFPTVNAQIRSVSDAEGAATAILIMNGGINDVDFEEVLNPDGDPKDVIESTIRGAFYTKLSQAFMRAKAKFPNAVIIYTGYFSAFSKKTDQGRLEEFVKYIKEMPGAYRVINDFLENPIGRWTPLGVIGICSSKQPKTRSERLLTGLNSLTATASCSSKRRLAKPLH